MSESSASVPPAYSGSAPATAKKGLSITSLVTGIAGLVLFLFPYFAVLSSIAAIVTGHLAKKREPATKGFWLTGLILGYVGLLVNLLLLAAVIAAFVAAANGSVSTAP